jgi:hypothetical protein
LSVGTDLDLSHAPAHFTEQNTLPSPLATAEEDGFEHFCPVLHTRPFAQMVGVARLTYRPCTRRTEGWLAELRQAAPGWIKTFEKLAEKGEEADFLREENYA